MKGWPVGICSRSSATIHSAPYVSEHEDGQFCSKECRTGKQPGRQAPEGRCEHCHGYCTMGAKPARRVPTFVFRADRAADVMALSQNTIGNRAPQSIFFKDSSERANSVIYGAVPSAGDFTLFPPWARLIGNPLKVKHHSLNTVRGGGGSITYTHDRTE